MIRSFYSAVSAMITLEAKLDSCTSNISNANTTAYKAQDVKMKSFDEVMIQNKDKIVGNKNVTNKIGKLSLGAEIDSTTTKYTQGNINQTGNNTDFAIDGRGFFVVQSGNENVFTRDGNFTINNEGYLVTTTGQNVLGVNANGQTAPIYVGNARDFYLDDRNNVIVNGRNAGRLLTADFANYNSLERISDNYYRGANPNYNANVKVNQGYLEASNVNITDEMVNLMTISRNFESAQRVLSMIDDSLSIAASKVGKV